MRSALPKTPAGHHHCPMQHAFLKTIVTLCIGLFISVSFNCGSYNLTHWILTLTLQKRFWRQKLYFSPFCSLFIISQNTTSALEFYVRNFLSRTFFPALFVCGSVWQIFVAKKKSSSSSSRSRIDAAVTDRMCAINKRLNEMESGFASHRSLLSSTLK